MLQRRQVLTGMSALCVPAVLRGGQTQTELCLLLDYSRSMFVEGDDDTGYIKESDHHQIQRDGHITALRSPEIAEFLVWHQVSVQVYAWSDQLRPAAAQVISSALTLDVLVRDMERYLPRAYLGSGSTMHHLALKTFSVPPPEGLTRIIDISTDEAPIIDWREKCRAVRDSIAGYGGRVNALAVSGVPSVVDLIDEHLPTQNGGFTEVAKGWDDYARAIKSKLIGELF